jgi:hypothetical protein
MRYGSLSGLVLLGIGSLVGCGEAPATPEGTPDQGVVETTSAVTPGSFTLHNYQTGLCLGVAAGTPAEGTKLVTWDCDNSTNQDFLLNSPPVVPAPYLELVNLVAADRCVQPQGIGNDGEPIIISRCWSADDNINYFYADNWKFTAVALIPGHACFNIGVEGAPEEVLTPSGGRTDRGTAVVLWHNFHDLTHHPGQAWCYYDATF